MNVYTRGTLLYAHAVSHLGRCCARDGDRRGAVAHCAHALVLLRVYTRALPVQHAAAALELGRALRHVVSAVGVGALTTWEQ